uniref:UPAR/Ly6 domain-containing protein n=1 Tax=Ciona savignyi TaxID=51511 RepID=H2YHS8_CIOSA
MLVIYVALCFHLAVQRVQAGECYDGTSTDAVGNMTVVSCDFSRESCMTKIELNHGVTILTRQCLQTKACGPNIANNQQQCYSENAINNQVQLCYFCCNDANLCNDFATIPPLPIQPTVFPPITDTTIFPPFFPETTTPPPVVAETTTPPPVVAETTTPPPWLPKRPLSHQWL